VEKLLYRIIGEDIDFRTVLADEGMYIMADSNQLEQVFINLIGNSRDAMPKGGELVLKTEAVLIDDDFIRTHAFGKPGKYAEISVSDSGTGMDEATREKIFEPFFTTKDVDKGTGLGLSIIYGIIKQHKGYIDVQTSPGEGTIFKIYLPIVDTPAYTISEVRQTDPLPVRGTETILVAEDNEMILKLITTILTEYGYKVITACDGEDALNKYVESKDAIDFVISDLVMPKKSGRDLHDKIKILNPDIKILFLSGYSEELMHREDMIEQNINLMSKPVNTNDLLKKVRELLDTKCIH
jgi:CheY-like chemotaxis protein